MAAKMKLNVTPDELLSFAKELRRLAENAEEAARRMQADKESSFATFGINHAVEGMDSLAGVFAQLVSRYDSRPAELTSIRKKIEEWRIEQQTRKDAAMALIAEIAGHKSLGGPVTQRQKRLPPPTVKKRPAKKSQKPPS